MGRFKIKKRELWIDMTPMSDVMVLLLTFFMLTATFVKPEPVKVQTPGSVSSINVPDHDVLTILIDPKGRIFMSLDKKTDMMSTLDAISEKYNISFTLDEKRTFGSVPSFGVPINELKSFLDLELGASIGALYYDYDKYRLDRESNCYVRTSSKKGFLMYPVVTDLRVAMVYRYGHSVKNKYKFDQVKQLARVEAKTIYNKHRQEQRDSVNAAREKERKIKLAAKAEKATADSIAKATAKAEKAAKDSLAREQAKSAKAEKQAKQHEKLTKNGIEYI